MSIIQRTNISSDTIIINQCDKNSYRESNIKGNKVRIYSCFDRGLSKSRNMAIQKSTADICLLCDDDEHLENDYAKKIIEAYTKYPEVDLMIFKIQQPKKESWKTCKRIGYLDALKISSWQISFKRNSIIKNSIFFNESFGAGTKFSAGEENIFLYDCLNKGLKIYFVPILVGTVAQVKSTWFKGFTSDFFINRGIVTRFYMGCFFATLYAAYYSLAKYGRYRVDSTFIQALTNMLRGIYDNKIERPY